MTDLIQRLKEAGEPLRDLDHEIMTRYGGAEHIDNGIYYGPNEIIWYRGDYEEDSQHPPLPYVTSSIDAALALAIRVGKETMFASRSGAAWRYLNQAMRRVSDFHNRHVGDIPASEIARWVCIVLIETLEPKETP